MARSKYRNSQVQNLEGYFLDILEKEAQDFVGKTINEVKVGHPGGFYEHDTFNLYDSYGYGIYLDGRLLRSSATNDTRPKKATEPRKWYRDEFFGKELMRKLFSDKGYKPAASKGYVVVIGAAMPYAIVLEKGLSHGMRMNYKVITFMDTEAAKFGNKFGIRVKSVRREEHEIWRK